MPRSLPSARSVVTALVAALATAGCGSDGGGTTSPGGHIAVYSWETSALVVTDSIRYADASGALVTVLTPSTGWTQTVGVPSGGAIEARAWGQTTGGGQTVKLKVEWVPQGGGTILQDSSAATLAAPQSFAMTIARRTI